MMLAWALARGLRSARNAITIDARTSAIAMNISREELPGSSNGVAMAVCADPGALGPLVGVFEVDEESVAAVGP